MAEKEKVPKEPPTIADIWDLSKDPGAWNDAKLDRKVSGLEVIESKQLIGLEIEVEKADVAIKLPSKVWVAKADGSLRNLGTEWITQPIPACDAPFALHELFDAGVKECCFSPRTSVHVHMNCRDLTREQVRDVVLLYLHIERMLYNFVGRSRYNNIYCVPLNTTPLITGFLEKKFENLPTSWKKYTGLNLCPIRTLGTLEFRHMHGTNDVQKLSIWIRLLTKLFDYARKVGTTELRGRLAKTTTRILQAQLAREVFGEDFQHLGVSLDRDAITAKQAWFRGTKSSELDLDSYHLSPFANFKGK